MRTFIAIELPPEIQKTLSRYQNKLKRTGIDVKWVEDKNIHLTLKFIGEINENQLHSIIQALREISRIHAGFEITLSSIGAFPGIQSPRVIWAGISKGDAEIKNLAREIEKRISALGFQKETREFSSHITLGRTRSSSGKEEFKKIIPDINNAFSAESIGCVIKEIILFKSTLTPRGPIYEAVEKFGLVLEGITSNGK